METTQLRIDSTDVFLTNQGPGQGKLIISNDSYGYNFSYYWGSMGKGTDLKSFLLDISPGYFVGKLGPNDRGDIDIKATMKAIRKNWVDYGYPWYEFMDKQRDLRRELRYIENHCHDDRGFVERINRLDEEFKPLYNKSCDFYKALSCIITEPWNFIVNKPHKQNVWLNEFHTKLVKALTHSSR